VRTEWYYLLTHVRKYPDDSRTRHLSEMAGKRPQTRRRVPQKLRDRLHKCFLVFTKFVKKEKKILKCYNAIRHKKAKNATFPAYYWKFSFLISMVYSQAPSTLRRRNLKNAAYFLRLGLPSTLIRHENGAFGKRFSNRTNLKTPACILVWTENILKTELFGNDDITMTSR